MTDDFLPTERGFYETRSNWKWKCQNGCSFEHVSRGMTQDDIDEEMKFKVRCPSCSVNLPRPVRV